MPSPRIQIIEQSKPEAGTTHFTVEAAGKKFFLAFEEHIAAGDILRLVMDAETGEVCWNMRDDLVELPPELHCLIPPKGMKVDIEFFYSFTREDYTGPTVTRKTVSRFWVILPVKDMENAYRKPTPMITKGYRAFRDKISASMEIIGKAGVMTVAPVRGSFLISTRDESQGEFYTTIPLELDVEKH
jgi:hypothetical protein